MLSATHNSFHIFNVVPQNKEILMERLTIIFYNSNKAHPHVQFIILCLLIYSNFGCIGCMAWVYRNIQIIKCLLQLKEFQICFIAMVLGLTLNIVFWFVAIFTEKCNLSNNIVHKMLPFLRGLTEVFYQTTVDQ